MRAWPYLDGDRIGFRGGFIRFRTDPAVAEIVVTDPHSGAGVFVRHDERETTEHWYARQEAGVSVPGETWTEIVRKIRDGDPVRAELKASLDDALSQIQRLSDERDELKGKLEWVRESRDFWEDEEGRTRRQAEAKLAQLTEERDRMTAQRDEAVRHAAVREALRPISMAVPAELFTKPSDDVDELKAVIVSQARELARLKGESE